MVASAGVSGNSDVSVRLPNRTENQLGFLPKVFSLPLCRWFEHLTRRHWLFGVTAGGLILDLRSYLMER